MNKRLADYFELFSRSDRVHTFIRDGKVIASVEYCAGSHCWYEDETVRDASELDYAVAMVEAEIDRLQRKD